jgi:hypothetical protein
MRPRLFLLDAGPIIELHRLGLWEKVVGRTELMIPSIVAGQEAEFWDSGEGIGKPIDLGQSIASGSIKIVEADAKMLAETLDQFDPSLVASVHSGELEALALINTWQDETLPSFCTGDRLATVALCLMGHSNLAVSLEELLKRAGLQGPLRRQFLRRSLACWVKEGRRRYIAGEGLR